MKSDLHAGGTINVCWGLLWFRSRRVAALQGADGHQHVGGDHRIARRDLLRLGACRHLGSNHVCMAARIGSLRCDHALIVGRSYSVHLLSAFQHVRNSGAGHAGT